MLLEGKFKSKSLGGNTVISVVLPEDKINFLAGESSHVKKPYKTLYLLHPLYGDHTSYLNHSNIRELAVNYNLAVVFPDCGNSYFLDNEKSNLFYSKFVCEELVEFTRNIFPLSHKREDTFIAGFSMGGYGALRNGLKYSETFSKIGAFSPALLNELTFMLPIRNKFFKNAKKSSRPAFEPVNKIKGTDKDYKFFLKQLINEDKEIPDIFLTCGKQDFLYLLTKLCDGYLKHKKVKHTFMSRDGEHNWTFLNNILEDFLKWVIN